MRRHKFSLSHYRLMTGNMGLLYPINVMEVLPGDTVQQATSLLLRCAPMLAPVMHPVRVRIHHWYVPNRLIWGSTGTGETGTWEDFITGGEDGMDTTQPPTLRSPPAVGWTVGSLADHLGLPVDVPDLEVSALPFRAYALIYNEHYRDQDLQVDLQIGRHNGPEYIQPPDQQTSQALVRCSWEKDYFTSSRPWEQKGPSISLPIGVRAPVVPQTASSGPVFRGNHTAGGPTQLAGVVGSPNVVWSAGNAVSSATTMWYASGLEADLTNASAVTISRLREAFALQRFEEARARYGSRYVEYLRYLGVRSSDGRLQSPEYLGGGKQTIQFSEVLQTADTDAGVVGDMKGHGIGAMRSNRYRRFFEEHGIVMSLLSVQPKTMYMQGVARQWNRRVKEDYWQKELQHIGQQEILNKELDAKNAAPDGVFGYQDRYDEYRRKESSVTGEFRTSVLNHWHLAREFATPPALNSTFIECTPTERIFAAQENDQLYIMANHSIQARRMVAGVANSFIY